PAPSVAELTKAVVAQVGKKQDGFVVQVEGGKVDGAARANRIGGLVYDQLAFEEAVEAAIAFAEADGETLVVITTDHGNANPGLFGGSFDDFDRVISFKHTNDWILQGMDRGFTADQVIERIEAAQGIVIRAEDAMR